MISSLGNCAATGRDMEEMLDKLEEEVRSVLASRGEPEDAEIEFVGFNA